MRLNKNELQKLALFLQKHAGLVLEEQKLARFSRKIEDVITKHKFKDFGSFYHAVRFGDNEQIRQDLINAVTVNETYFWRESEQFIILVNEILPTFLEKSGSSLPKVRILVSPCSTGEEVYSLMFAILEAPKLIDKMNVEVIGIDIDSNVIEQAKKGIYTKRSVEKLPATMRKKYFTQLGKHYKIKDFLVKAANFLQANIFDEGLEASLGSFDIVFSRNMLIYFDIKDRQKAFETFYKLLKENAYLFLGHADANHIDKKKFRPVKIQSQIYQKIK
jgi:chemotaxis protein methyltransferase CheR